MMLSSYHLKGYWQTSVSDTKISQTEVLEIATETVNQIVEDIPKDLTPEQEREYLYNCGQALGRACMIIQEMIAAKPAAVLN